MGDKMFNILGSIIVLATVTTLILPNRQTVGVLNAAGSAFTGSIRTAMGN